MYYLMDMKKKNNNNKFDVDGIIDFEEIGKKKHEKKISHFE